MSLPKFTKGPWLLDPTLPGKVYSNDATGSIIATATGFDLAPRPNEEMLANTALIHAGPDYDEAAAKIIAFVSDPGTALAPTTDTNVRLVCNWLAARPEFKALVAAHEKGRAIPVVAPPRPTPRSILEGVIRAFGPIANRLHNLREPLTIEEAQELAGKMVDAAVPLHEAISRGDV